MSRRGARSRMAVAIVVAAAAVLTVAPAPAAAVDGHRDQSWADAGVLTVDLGRGRDLASAVTRQADGRLLVAGEAAEEPQSGEPYPMSDGYLVRLSPAGAPDLVLRRLSGEAGRTFSPAAIAVDDAGRIVLAGAVWAFGSMASPLTVLRLLPTGERDASFGTGGRRDYTPAGGNGQFSDGAALALGPDGTLLVATTFEPAGGGDRPTTVLRLLPDGTPDPSWSDDGEARIPALTEFTRLRGGIAAHGTGVVVAGALRARPAVARLNGAGALDATFGSGGFAQLTPSDRPLDYATFTDVATLGDGRIVAVGWEDVSLQRTEAVVARFLPVGQPDQAFGSGGRADVGVTAEDEFPGNVEVVAGTGRVLVQGEAGVYPYRDTILLLAVTPAGALDPAFGDGGRLGFEVPGAEQGVLHPGFATQADGRPVVAGAVGPDSHVMRLTATGAEDTTFDGDGHWIRNLGRGGRDGVADSAMAADGSILTAGDADGNVAVSRVTPAGALDTAFGSGGTASIPDIEGGTARAVAPAPDGGAYAIGVFDPHGGARHALVRLTASGAPNDGFAAGVLLEQDEDQSAARPFVALAVDGSSRPVVLSSTDVDGTSWITVLRFTAAGEPDPSFGDGGASLVAPGTGSAVAVEPDGHVVIAGVGPGTTRELVLHRLAPSGEPDPAFAATRPGGPSDRVTWVDALALYPDGRIALAGQAQRPGTSGGGVARFLPTGAADPSFGTNGLAFVDAFSGWAVGLGVQPDGKLVTTAKAWTNHVAVRLTETGQEDPAFGPEGASNDLPIDTPVSAHVDAAGFVYAVGESTQQPGVGEDVTVVRLLGSSGAPAPPTVAGVDPNQFCTDGHSPVRITGSGFATARSVSFENGGGESPYFRVVSDTVIDAFTPPGPGTLDGHVVVTNGAGRSERSAGDRFRQDACAAERDADLRVTATGPGATVPVGDTADLRATVENQSSFAAVGVTLTAKLPAGLELVGAVPERGRCARTTTLSCSLLDFFPHDRVAVDVRVRVVAAGAHALTFVGDHRDDDPDPADDKATVAVAGHQPRSGYWMLADDGRVWAFGRVPWLGNAPTSAAVDIEATSSGNGYWVADRWGRVFVFGDARHAGDAPPLHAGEAVAGVSGTKSGRGYWLFTSHGRAFAYGDARHRGDMAGHPLNGPVIDSVKTPTDAGYFMVASDGGIFGFGDARFRGSMGGQPLNGPVVGLAPDPDGVGYWEVAADGGIFAFDAAFRGSMGGQRLNRPVVGMVAYGDGYLMVGEDGGIFNFSSKPFDGSLGANPPSRPIVSVAAFAS